MITYTKFGKPQVLIYPLSRVSRRQGWQSISELWMRRTRGVSCKETAINWTRRSSASLEGGIRREAKTMLQH